MSRRGRWGAALVGFCVMANAGSSWLFVTSPKTSSGEPNYDCTESGAAPAIDVTLGVLDAVGGAANIGSSNAQTHAIGMASIVWAGVFLGSAIHGFSATSDCKDLKAAGRLPTGFVPRPRPAPLAPPPGSKGQPIAAPPPPPAPPPIARPLPPPFDRPVPIGGGPDGGAPDAPPAPPPKPAVPQATDPE